MIDNKEQRTERDGNENGNGNRHILPRETTMKSVASAIGVMSMEETIRRGGEVNIPGLDITLTREDLFGPEPERSSKNTSDDH